jgi:hypothetical protein
VLNFRGRSPPPSEKNILKDQKMPSRKSKRDYKRRKRQTRAIDQANLAALVPAPAKEPEKLIVKPFVNFHYREWSGLCSDHQDVNLLGHHSFFNDDLERLDLNMMVPDDHLLLEWNPHDPINFNHQSQPVYNSYEFYSPPQPFHGVGSRVVFKPKSARHIVALMFENKEHDQDPDSKFSDAVGQYFMSVNPGACIRAYLYVLFGGSLVTGIIYSYLTSQTGFKPEDFSCFYARYCHGSDAWTCNPYLPGLFKELAKPEYHWTQEEAKMIQSRRNNLHDLSKDDKDDKDDNDNNLFERIHIKFRYPALYSFSELVEFIKSLQHQAYAEALQRRLFLMTQST